MTTDIPFPSTFRGYQMTRRIAALALILTTFGVAAPPGAIAQEKSVRPGINDSFKDPEVTEWVTRFEGESREVFEKRKEIVAACKLKPGMTVADVGAGTGLFTRLFARRSAGAAPSTPWTSRGSSSTTSRVPRRSSA